MNSIRGYRDDLRAAWGLILPLACIANLFAVQCLAMPLLSPTGAESKRYDPPQSAHVAVDLKQNLLTVQADHARLGEVLAAISSRTAVTIFFQGSAEIPVTASMSDTTIEEAIRRLTLGSSYAFIYAPKDPQGNASRLSTVFVYSGSPGLYSIFGEPATASTRPTDSEPKDSTTALKRQENKVPTEDKGRFSSVIDLALHSDKAETRVASIEFLAGVGQEWVTDTLIQVLGDNEARVRTAGVQALGQYSGAKALNALRAALDDPVPEVRRAAMLVIDEMDNGEREDPSHVTSP